MVTRSDALALARGGYSLNSRAPKPTVLMPMALIPMALIRHVKNPPTPRPMKPTATANHELL